MTATQPIYLRKATVAIAPKAGGEGIAVSDLRISFNIEKSSESNPNVSKISIYNLNPTNRAFLESEKLQVVLSAGYETYQEIIFAGDIRKASSMRTGPDWVTTIESGDGEAALTEVTTDKSYGPGTDLKTVFNDLIGGLGLSKGNVDLSGVTATVQNGLTVSGRNKEQLDELTKKQGLEWSVQNGAVQVTKQGAATQVEAVLISPETGLIGAPAKREKGIEFTAALNPKLVPGRSVQVQGSAINGVYVVRKATFDGDTREGNWTVKVEAL